MTAEDIVRKIRDSARTDCEGVLKDGLTNGKPYLDAYAAALSIDTPSNMRLRAALLDLNGVTKFDNNDVGLFAQYYKDSDKTYPDYSRYDLNGDGYSGGDPKPGSRFDLDADGVFEGAVAVPNNAGVKLDENRVSDVQVLCYYAQKWLSEAERAGLAQQFPDEPACGRPSGTVIVFSLTDPTQFCISSATIETTVSGVTTSRVGQVCDVAQTDELKQLRVCREAIGASPLWIPKSVFGSSSTRTEDFSISADGTMSVLLRTSDVDRSSEFSMTYNEFTNVLTSGSYFYDSESRGIRATSIGNVWSGPGSRLADQYTSTGPIPAECY